MHGHEVRTEWFAGPRDALAELFALADDSPDAVARYRELGSVVVATEAGTIVGHAQLLPDAGTDEVELKSLAVLESRRRQGVGRMLVDRVAAECRRTGCGRIVVSTAAADTDVLRFYQRLGFRFARVERDAFTTANGYPAIEIDGVPLRDRVWLSLDL